MLRLRFAALLQRLLLLLLIAGVPAAALRADTGSPEAPVRIPSVSIPDPIASLLSEGRALEESGRWDQVLLLYEQALRDYPGNRVLSDRLDLARMHHSLDRRYADASFTSGLSNLDARAADQLYGEVLQIINSRYVVKPSWSKLVTRGTMALDVALADGAFCRHHLPNVPRRQIDPVRNEIYQIAAAQPINTCFDAQRAAANVVAHVHQRLGLRESAATLEYVAGATGGLDDYSAYLTGAQLRDVYSQIDGNFVGLGVELKADEGALLIVHVIPGSPAQRAGLVSSDRIVAVDGQATAGVSTTAAASLLQGEVDSTVQLTIVKHDARRYTVAVRRQHVEVPSVEGARIIDATKGIAYAKLPSFQKTTSRDLENTLWKLNEQGMQSLVLDLRGNPGGLLTAAVEVADKFIENGAIVSTKGRSPDEQFNYLAHEAGTWRVPLVVLIDGDSASASEIFAAAIHDHHRGTVVGTRSYGKGSVQGIFQLSHAGAGVRLTTAKFFSPDGHPISKVGIQPDIDVRHAARLTPSQTSALPEVDEILNRGVMAASRQLASR